MLGLALQSMPCLVDGFFQDRATACILAEQPICSLCGTAVITKGGGTFLPVTLTSHWLLLWKPTP